MPETGTRKEKVRLDFEIEVLEGIKKGRIGASFLRNQAQGNPVERQATSFSQTLLKCVLELWLRIDDFSR